MFENKRFVRSAYLLAILAAVVAGCIDLASGPEKQASTAGKAAPQGPRPRIQTAVQRPLSDFISAQGTTSIFQVPVPDYIGWGSNTARYDCRFALVDYAGLAAKWIADNGGPSLGTQVSGSVTERALNDGRAEVTVVLHTTKALVWVSTCIPDFSTGTLLLGSRAQDIAADPGNNPPALAISHFQIVFKNSSPGAPMPDLVNAFILGNAVPGQEIVSLAAQMEGSGLLHAAFGVAEGTPGAVKVTQTGTLFRTPFGGATADGFPAENVDLHVISQGRGKNSF
jgi:hypothetical protein